MVQSKHPTEMNIGNCTFNGLSNEEFSEIKSALQKDVESLQRLIESDSGHLGDIVGCLRTTMSSINLKAEKLSLVFKEQKSTHTEMNTELEHILQSTECMHCGQTTLINHKSLLNMLKLPTSAKNAQVRSVEPSTEQSVLSAKEYIGLEWEKGKKIGEIVEGFANLRVQQEREKWEKEKQQALNASVSALYFDDSSDYSSYHYKVIMILTGEENPDVDKLYKILNHGN